MSRTLHVAPHGNDHTNHGGENSPFRTVSYAATLARPGDAVLVHAGVYREWIRPCTGGTSDAARITFAAAPGEDVVLTGSEVISDWQQVDGDVWKTTIPDTFFRHANPFRELLSGDWFLDKERRHHTGDVYLDGTSLFEAASLDDVHNAEPYGDSLTPESTRLKWYVDKGDEQVTIFANFGGADPAETLVEVTARPAVLFPEHTGINYITVRGFEIRHAATPWAPPTALQMGAIGPHWSKGWIIEDCHVHNVRCTGICLGTERSTGDNSWSHGSRKHGTQTQREAVFHGLRSGWCREKVGSHIVRRNHIHDCEQAGIVGHMGCVFSCITDNHIHHIHWKRAFTGYEMAGIKFHAPIDTLIARNHIHHCVRGMWMDWQTQGTRISQNLLYENGMRDLWMEVSHGPYVVDNNIFLSDSSLVDAAQGGAYINNLFTGWVRPLPVLNRFTHYHFPHSTEVMGMAIFPGGDNRFRNNVFARAGRRNTGETEIVDEELSNDKKGNVVGTVAYNDCPTSEDEMDMGDHPGSWAKAKLPVDIRDNWYGRGTHPYHREEGAIVEAKASFTAELIEDNGTLILRISVPQSLVDASTDIVTGESLGQAFQPEASFEDWDGTKLTIDTDYLGDARTEDTCLGPFANLVAGEQDIIVWPFSGETK